MLFFLCILLLPSRRRNNLQEVIAVQSRPKFAYEIVENDLISNQNKAKNDETEIQKGTVFYIRNYCLFVKTFFPKFQCSDQ